MDFDVFRFSLSSFFIVPFRCLREDGLFSMGSVPKRRVLGYCSRCLPHSPLWGILGWWVVKWTSPHRLLLVCYQASSAHCLSLSPPDEGKVTVRVTAPSAGPPEGGLGGGRVWDVSGSPWGCAAGCGTGMPVSMVVLSSPPACLLPARCLVGPEPGGKQ